jgi:hypothetical protein
MILSPDDLKGKTVKELRAIATDFHASWHQAEKADALIARICELSAIVQPNQKAPEAAPTVAKPASAERVSKDVMLAQLQPSIEVGLLIKFTDDGKSWAMRFRDKTDSGSMTMPLKNIQRCADMILRSRLHAMPKCQLCGEFTEYSDKLGYICVNAACKRSAKPANPGKAA